MGKSELLLQDVRETSRLYQSIEDCTCRYHYKPVTKEDIQDRPKHSGYKYQPPIYKPVPDRQVCEKERLWRRYCRLRDEYIKNVKKVKAS